MGSVTKRFKRNQIAANLAHKVGVKTPPAIMKREDGPDLLLFSKYLSPLHYRTLMLRVAKSMRERLREEHVIEQARAGRRLRLDAFFGKKSWLRRMLEKIFPSLVNDIKQEAKMERTKKRQQRNQQFQQPIERKGR